MKKLLFCFTIITALSCQKNGTQLTKNSSEVDEISTTQRRTVDENDITNGVWSSNNQFSTPYMQNGIYDTATNIIFEKNGTLTIFEGGSVKSCECKGKYIIDEKDRTLTISGIVNKNCSWLSMVNGSYSFTKDILASYTNKKNGIKFDYYQKL